MKRPLILVGTLVVGALALAGCSGSGGGGSDGGGDFVEGATFTTAVNADPGALDPQMSASSVLNQVSQFAYDSLVSIDPADGSIQSQLATEWTVEPSELTFTLADGITCADGSEFTAEMVVQNIEFVADPENLSPFLGVFVPPGTVAAADGNVVTVTFETPASFAVNGFATFPMICEPGLEDRGALAATTAGTGPYELTEAVPNDHYTYTIREGYTWGPAGATTSEPGLPASVVVRVIENETTAANLILSGEVNAGTVVGSDAQRLVGADLFAAESTAVLGEQWYNQSEERVTSDPAVRMALTQSADYAELVKVVGTGNGTAPTSFAALSPAACVGDSVTGAMPALDVDAAGALLDEAGWVLGADGQRSKDGAPLTVRFLYNAAMGPSGTAAAELIVPQWEALGVTVNAESQDPTVLQDSIFTTGDWDVVWIALNVSIPDQLIGFLSADSPSNFAGIANADYTAAVAAASALPGEEGCAEWLEAESALVSASDVFPFANTVASTFGNGAQFEVGGELEPLSVRMMG